MADDTTQAHPEGTILLVDDDKFLLDMYAMKFVKEHFTVETYLSVDEALTRLREGFAPDVVLFDIAMPEKDGFAFLQSLEEEKLAEGAIKIPLTNQSSDAEKAKAKEMGAEDYFVKATMIPSEVVNNVGELLAKRRA